MCQMMTEYSEKIPCSNPDECPLSLFGTVWLPVFAIHMTLKYLDGLGIKGRDCREHKAVVIIQISKPSNNNTKKSSYLSLQTSDILTLPSEN